MKKIFLVLTVVFFGVLACDNEPLEGEFVVDDGVVLDGTDDGTGDGTGDGTTDPDPTSGTFSAKIDGVDYFASGVNVAAVIILGDFNIAARDNVTGDEILITVQTASLGDFEFNSDDGVGVFGAYDPTADDADPTSSAYLALGEPDAMGTITLSELDLASGQTSGVFSFTAKREVFNDAGEIVTEYVEITEGEFNDVFYTDDIATGSDDTFTADIAGVPLNENSVLVSTIEAGGVTTINVSGINSDTGQVLGLSFNMDLVAGTYEFESLPSTGATLMTYTPDAGDPTVVYNAQAGGNFTITEITADGRYIGTFELTLEVLIDPTVPTIEVTNGVFSFIP